MPVGIDGWLTGAPGACDAAAQVGKVGLQGRFVLLLAKGLLESAGLRPLGGSEFRTADRRTDLMRGLSRMHLGAGWAARCGAEVVSKEAARGASRPSTVRPLCPHSEALACVMSQDKGDLTWRLGNYRK